MKRISTFIIIAALGAELIGLSGCASNSPYQTSTPYQGQYSEIGSIQSIQELSGDNRTSGTGAVIGGIVGAVIGNQVGGGTGRALTTVAGGIGGAVVGNQIENRRSSGRFQIVVQMQNGSQRVVEQNNINNLQIGSRVRITNGQVYLY